MNTLVQIPFGTLQGFEEDGVLKFYAVPFAKPPVGELRFRVPQMPEPWSGVREALEPAPNPMQRPIPPFTFANFSEDCLYANVFVPKDVQPGTPVIMWIPGSAFASGGVSGRKEDGGPNYNCARLAREGRCVVFAVNHRLNIFGYMNFRRYSDRFDDNLGQLDLIQALKWIQIVAPSFCGDVNNVTVAGLSAGACAINALMMTPSAYPLFHKCIIQSSCVESFFTVEEEDELCRLYLDKLGLDASRVEELLEMPYEKLYAAYWRFIGPMLAKYHPSCAVGPVIDGKLVQGFPTTYDYEGLDKPFIMGSTREEGWQQKLDYSWGLTPEDSKKRITWALQHMAPELREKLRPYYMNMEDGSPQAMTDIMYTITKARVAEKAGSRVPAYIYRYDYRTRGLEETGYHACHGTDHFTLFDLKTDRICCSYEQLAAGCEEEMAAVGNSMARHWGACAATGDPSLPDAPWPVYTPDTRYTYIFDKTDRVESDPERDVRLLFEGYDKFTRD